ncbi:MAG: hypothetical protein V5A77_00055 [Candidatus Bipolaricaulota bacterium]
MGELKTVDEIGTSYSKSQIYWRINKLVESGLMDPPERGERNEYLLNPEQSGILKKLSEVEENHDTVKEAIGNLKEEKLEVGPDQELLDRVEELEERVVVLEDKVKALERGLTVQDDRQQKCRDRWKNQLKEGAKKVKDLFG